MTVTPAAMPNSLWAATAPPPPATVSLAGGAHCDVAVVGGGALTTVIGVSVLGPVLARPLGRAIGAPLRLRGVTGELATHNAMRNPKRTARTAASLMIGVGLVGSRWEHADRGRPPPLELDGVGRPSAAAAFAGPGRGLRRRAGIGLGTPARTGGDRPPGAGIEVGTDSVVRARRAGRHLDRRRFGGRVGCRRPRRSSRRPWSRPACRRAASRRP